MTAWATIYRERDWTVRRQMFAVAPAVATGLTLVTTISGSRGGPALGALTGTMVEGAGALYQAPFAQADVAAALAALPDGASVFESVTGPGYFDVCELYVGSNPPPGV